MRYRHIIVAGFALSFVLTACSVGFNPRQDGKFVCSNDSDCLSGFECSQDGLCVETTGGQEECIDEDGDGYGVNNRSSCPKSGADCVDSPSDLNCGPQQSCDVAGLSCTGESCSPPGGGEILPSDIHPGQTESCDGYDNDCDGQIDEPNECEDSVDCPSGPENARPECNQDGECVYEPFIQNTQECRELTVTCENGSYEPPIPEDCKS